MKKRCKHLVRQLYWRWFGAWIDHRPRMCSDAHDAEVCERCHEWLPLGESTDTPATAIELDAARCALECADKPECAYLVAALIADVSSPAHDTIRLAVDIIDHKDSTP